MIDRLATLTLVLAACSGSATPETTRSAPSEDPVASRQQDEDSDGSAPQRPRPASRPAGFADDCYTLVRDVDAWYPVASIADADERELFSWIVRLRVGEECRWDTQTFDDRSCFAAARDVTEERACVDAIGFTLTPRGRDPLGDLAAAMHAIDGAPSCEEAADAYLSNFRWWIDPHHSLTGNSGERDLAAEQRYTPNAMKNYTAEEQAALIADSRAAFAKACADEGWSPAVRTCILAAWPGFERTCLLGIDGAPSRPRRWTAPPLDRVATFDATCDAYLAAAAELATCGHDPEVDLALSRAVDIARAVARTKKLKKADPEVTRACERLHAALTELAADRCPIHDG